MGVNIIDVAILFPKFEVMVSVISGTNLSCNEFNCGMNIRVHFEYEYVSEIS